LIEACNVKRILVSPHGNSDAPNPGVAANLISKGLQHPNHGLSARSGPLATPFGRPGKTARAAGRAAPNLLAALPFSVARAGLARIAKFGHILAGDSDTISVADLKGASS
jgi:hypothetical protein